jgi:hypothetical protein
MYVQPLIFTAGLLSLSSVLSNHIMEQKIISFWDKVLYNHAVVNFLEEHAVPIFSLINPEGEGTTFL